MSFDEPSWIEATAAGARNPLNWENSAAQLKRAADLLTNTWRDDVAAMLSNLEQTLRRVRAGEPFPHVVPVLPAAVLLLGLALENALKGVLVAQAPERFVQPNSGDPDLLPLGGRVTVTISSGSRPRPGSQSRQRARTR